MTELKSQAMFSAVTAFILLRFYFLFFVPTAFKDAQLVLTNFFRIKDFNLANLVNFFDKCTIVKAYC